jgi:hypothetical protein
MMTSAAREEAYAFERCTVQMKYCGNAKFERASCLAIVLDHLKHFARLPQAVLGFLPR